MGCIVLSGEEIYSYYPFLSRNFDRYISSLSGEKLEMCNLVHMDLQRIGAVGFYGLPEELRDIIVWTCAFLRTVKEYVLLDDENIGLIYEYGYRLITKESQDWADRNSVSYQQLSYMYCHLAEQKADCSTSKIWGKALWEIFNEYMSEGQYRLLYREVKVTCSNCGLEFRLRGHEQHFYFQKGMSLPKRCRNCNVNKQRNINRTA